MADQERFSDPAEIRHIIGSGGTFSLHGVSGDVEIRGADTVEARGLAGEQSYRSVSGDITVNGHGGRISLTTVSGDAELCSDQPMSANLTTTSGDVEIAAPMLDALQLRTV